MNQASNDKQAGSGLTRRGFLTGMTVAGTAAALGVTVQAQAGAPVDKAADTAGPGNKGYHETQHVRDYYQTARL